MSVAPSALDTVTASPADCLRALNSEAGACLIDVRTGPEFATVHAVRARSLPLDRVTAAAVAEIRGGGEQTVFLICQSGARAAKAQAQLALAGVGNLRVVEGGTVGWEQAGLPVERGHSRVISLERQVRIAAGLLVFTGACLAWLVHPGFLAVPAFVGAGLTVSGVTNTCGMGLLIAKMPWNR